MAAEEENKKDAEDAKEEPKPNLKEKFRNHWQIGLKILELLLCAFCIGCAYDSIKTIGIGISDLHHIGIMYTAYTGYILINLSLLTSSYLGDTIPYRTSSLFSITAAALFLVTGVLLIVDRSTYMSHYEAPGDRPQLVMILVSGILALANAVVFIIDAVLTFRRQEDF